MSRAGNYSRILSLFPSFFLFKLTFVLVEAAHVHCERVCFALSSANVFCIGIVSYKEALRVIRELAPLWRVAR